MLQWFLPKIVFAADVFVPEVVKLIAAINKHIITEAIEDGIIV